VAGEGDDATVSKEETAASIGVPAMNRKPTGDGEVLDADEEATPASFGLGGGEAGEGGDVAEPREATARPDGAWARR
jgi:hypothetical protein